MKIDQKVFGIGFHKTGTSSLALALKMMGYNCNRGLYEMKIKWGYKKCVQLLKDKDYGPYIDFVKEYNATLDNPWYLLYKELDETFPGSKFILTYREEEQWVKSCTHYFKGTDNLYRNWLYGTSEVEGNEEKYLKKYRSHIEEVEDYFKNRQQDLLKVNWEEGHGWDQLCQFIDKPILKLPFPHINRKGDQLHQPHK